MTDTTVYSLISADAHVIEPPDLFERRLPASLRGRAPKVVGVDGGSGWSVDGGEPVPLPRASAIGTGGHATNGSAPRPASFDEVLPGLHDPAERLALQDASSVDAEVLYPLPALWDAIRRVDDPEVERACVRAYNEWIAEFSAHRRDRLIGLGKIPTTSLQDAIDELRRCVEDLGLRGVVLDAWPGDGASAEAFWEIVDTTGVPVSIHYTLGRDARTAPPTGVAPGMNPPIADIGGQSLSPLLATGMLDRYPNIRLVLAHANAGWAIHWLEFMDNLYIRGRHLESRKLPFKNEDDVPSEYIRRHFWFTFHQDRSAVKNRHLLGSAHLMWSSHFGFDAAAWPGDREQAMRVTDGVSAGERQALLAENTARLYRLPGYEGGFSADAISAFEQLVHL